MAKKKKIRVFRAVKDALGDAISFERGQLVGLRVVEIPRPRSRMRPEEIRRIRRTLKASQAVFALLLNVSPKAVQSWEQGARRPRNASLKLLRLAKKNPRVLLSA
jgi:putative transcriptional regulator